MLLLVVVVVNNTGAKNVGGQNDKIAPSRLSFPVAGVSDGVGRNASANGEDDLVGALLNPFT